MGRCQFVPRRVFVRQGFSNCVDPLEELSAPSVTRWCQNFSACERRRGGTMGERLDQLSVGRAPNWCRNRARSSEKKVWRAQVLRQFSDVGSTTTRVKYFVNLCPLPTQPLQPGASGRHSRRMISDSHRPPRPVVDYHEDAALLASGVCIHHSDERSIEYIPVCPGKPSTKTDAARECLGKVRLSAQQPSLVRAGRGFIIAHEAQSLRPFSRPPLAIAVPHSGPGESDL